MYADDIKIWRTLSTDSDRDNLQDDLDIFTTWLNNHHLTQNADKCVCMHINQRATSNYSHHISGVPLRVSACERDLGSRISADLSLTPNTDKITKLAWSRMGVLNRLMGRPNPQTFPVVFKSLVRPLLEVNIQALNPYLIRDIRAIENVQRRATKRVVGLWDTPYTERLKILKLFPLDYRRFRGDLILMYKIMRTEDHPLQAIFDRSLTHTRGHPFKVNIRLAQSNIRKYSFSIRACKPWNSLPSELVLLDSLDSFKLGIDKLYNEGRLGFTSSSDT